MKTLLVMFGLILMTSCQKDPIVPNPPVEEPIEPIDPIDPPVNI